MSKHWQYLIHVFVCCSLLLTVPRSAFCQTNYEEEVSCRSYMRDAIVIGAAIAGGAIAGVIASKDGERGLTGRRGLQGLQGPPGLQGLQGPEGQPGPTGPRGPRGNLGATGATGPAGPTGATGTIGPTGATGATGPTGAGPFIADTGETLQFVSNAEVFPLLGPGGFITLTPFVIAPDGTFYQLPAIDASGGGAISSFPGIIVTNPVFGTYNFGFLVNTNDALATPINFQAGAVVSSRYGTINVIQSPSSINVPTFGIFNSQSEAQFNYLLTPI